MTNDGNIWFRNYQIINENSDLQEIGNICDFYNVYHKCTHLGPRFVLELVRVFEGSFKGSILYDNLNYISPNEIRRRLKAERANKQNIKIEQKECIAFKDEFVSSVKLEDPVGEIFDTTTAGNNDGTNTAGNNDGANKASAKSSLSKKIDGKITKKSKKTKKLLQKSGTLKGKT